MSKKSGKRKHRPAAQTMEFPVRSANLRWWILLLAAFSIVAFWLVYWQVGPAGDDLARNLEENAKDREGTNRGEAPQNAQSHTINTSRSAMELPTLPGLEKNRFDSVV